MSVSIRLLSLRPNGYALDCGLIYNDFTSLPLRLFDTGWNEHTQTFDAVYPFGVDYVRPYRFEFTHASPDARPAGLVWYRL